MKKLILATLATLSFTANASENFQAWTKVENNYITIGINTEFNDLDDPSHDITEDVYVYMLPENGSVNLTFYVKDDKCKDRKGSDIDELLYPKFKVDGQWIKSVKGCNDFGRAFYSATSKKGMQFINNTFMAATKMIDVDINGTIYTVSPNGYTASYLWTIEKNSAL